MTPTSIARLESPGAAAAWCRAEHEAGRSIGLVPTMGALHAGHLALVERALAENDRVCASVFVNPLQFDDPRDLERYPRDEEADARKLEVAGCAMMFGGTLAGFFPEAAARAGLPERRVDPGPGALGLEGEFRAGHFGGVATIVARLFELTGPERAYFGQKDFQQTLVVQDVARRQGGPEVVVCPTVRDASGLALSSRNLLLGEAEQAAAGAIPRALLACRAAWDAGVRDAAALARTMHVVLAGDPLRVEYAEVRDPEAWTAEAPAGRLERAVALIAAHSGSVRLIDNLLLSVRDPSL